jgi:nicotinate-nucleotide adenylyltransferase
VEELRLDKVLFVPNAVSPLKSAETYVSGRDRLAMVRAAIRGNRRFQALDDEIRRGGASYTFDTVRALSDRTSAKLYFLIGTDAVADLDRWHRARELARMVTFALFRRPGSLGAQPPPWAGGWVEVAAPLIEISSSEIRDRIRSGRSVRYLVPDAVAAILRKRRLYRSP